MNAPLLTLQMHGAQSTGRRSNQEDSYQYGAEDELAIGLMADGLGGHPCGEVASHAAVNTAWKALGEKRMAQGAIGGGDLVGAFAEAHLAVLSQSGRQKRCLGMGTTMVGLIADAEQSRLWACSVGDSRILRLEGDGMIDLMSGSHPESWGQGGPGLEYSLGLSWPGRGPRVVDATLHPGDRYLLASDGLESQSLRLISSIVREAGSPQDAVEQLLNAVADVGHPYQDNTTVVALFAEA